MLRKIDKCFAGNASKHVLLLNLLQMKPTFYGCSYLACKILSIVPHETTSTKSGLVLPISTGMHNYIRTFKKIQQVLFLTSPTLLYENAKTFILLRILTSKGVNIYVCLLPQEYNKYYEVLIHASVLWLIVPPTPPKKNPNKTAHAVNLQEINIRAGSFPLASTGRLFHV